MNYLKIIEVQIMCPLNKLTKRLMGHLTFQGKVNLYVAYAKMHVMALSNFLITIFCSIFLIYRKLHINLFILFVHLFCLLSVVSKCCFVQSICDDASKVKEKVALQSE